MSLKLTSLILISIFKNVINDNVVSLFVKLLKQLFSDEKNLEGDLKLYSDFVEALYLKNENQNLFEYILKLIYTDENIISKGCSDCIKENNQLLDTAKYELSLLYELVCFDYDKIKQLFNGKYSEMLFIKRVWDIFVLQCF